jgi:hypothetical protein
MTRTDFERRRAFGQAGVNDGEHTPELKGQFWTIALDPDGVTVLIHATTLERLP